MHSIGVISDTHGLLRLGALEALAGVELIIHAGDVGMPEVLEGLANIAPVRAVRGNVDREPWAQGLPETIIIDVAGALVFVLHNLEELDLDPVAASFDAVVYGHSHQPRFEQKGSVFYLNPGSAGPRRFTLPVSVARIHVSEGKLEPELIYLDI